MALFIYCIFLVWIIQTVAKDCWLNYEEVCITVHNQKVTYSEAYFECLKEDKGVLVILDSFRKHTVVSNKVAELGIFTGPYWIGLNNQHSDGVWQYSNGRRLDWSGAWAKNEPNNANRNEHCVELRSRSWNDIPCSHKLEFLCESRPSKPCLAKNLSISNAYFPECRGSSVTPHGSNIVFKCYNGYKLLQDTSKEAKATCDNGKWLVPGMCESVCYKPEFSNNMYLLGSKSVFKVGEEAKFVCQKGFFVENNKPVLIKSKTCMGINKWSSNELHCISSNHFDLNPANMIEPIIVEFSEGDSLTVNCTITENESSMDNFKYTWSKDSENVELLSNLFEHVNYTITTSGELNIINVNEIVAGTYMCLKETITDHKFQGITVYELRNKNKSCHDNYNKIEIVQFEVNQYAVLNCNGFQKCISSLMWLKDGKEIDHNNEHHLFLPNGSLLLKRISHDDSGLYSCKSTNLCTSCTSSNTVSLFVKPTAESICGKISNNSQDSQPWFVSFWWNDEQKPFCYGVVISEFWILSVSSCMANIRRRMYQNIHVKIGFRSDVIRNVYGYSTVESIIVHPRFSRRLLVNDLALVKLNNPLPLDDNVGIICLMTKANEESMIYRRECDPVVPIIGNVSSLGPLEGTEHTPYTESMIVSPNSQCTHMETNSSNDVMFCAKFIGESSLSSGDAGSPFIVEFRGKYFLFGIYSWGERISRVGKFDYFTKITTFYDWIKSNIK